MALAQACSQPKKFCFSSTASAHFEESYDLRAYRQDRWRAAWMVQIKCRRYSKTSMTQTIYGWMVVRQDGSIVHHLKTDALAIFEGKSLARRLSAGIQNSRIVPCTITL